MYTPSINKTMAKVRNVARKIAVTANALGCRVVQSEPKASFRMSASGKIMTAITNATNLIIDR
jgi:hypothetical protein